MPILKLPELATIDLLTVSKIFKSIKYNKSFNGIPIENIIPVFKKCLRLSKGTITSAIIKETYNKSTFNPQTLIDETELPNTLISKRKEEGNIILQWIIPILQDNLEYPIRFNIVIVSSSGQGSSRLARALHHGINKLYDKISSANRSLLINVDDPVNSDLTTIMPNTITILEGTRYHSGLYPRSDVSHIVFINDSKRSEISNIFNNNPIIWFELDNLDTDDIIEILQYIQNIKIINKPQIYEYITIMLKANINPKEIIFILKLASAMNSNNKHSNKLHILPSLFNEIIDKIKNPLPTIINIHTLGKRLNNIVYGQKEAIQTVVKSVGISHYGLKHTQKPISVMLFVGPTGTGKTLLSTTLSDEIFGKNKIIRLDMGEFVHSHYSSKVFGAPPGYTGFENESMLAQQLKKHKRCTIILDEIEKAHPDILNVFLAAFDSGNITMGNGEILSLTDTIVVMTSNALVNDMGKRTMAFSMKAGDNRVISDDIRKELVNHKIFTPEFMNRIDHVILFNTLTDNSAKRIAIKELEQIKQDLSFKGYTFKYDNKLITKVINLYNPQYGGRDIIRIIDKIRSHAVNEIITNKENTKIHIEGQLI